MQEPRADFALHMKARSSLDQHWASLVEWYRNADTDRMNEFTLKVVAGRPDAMTEREADMFRVLANLAITEIALRCADAMGRDEWGE